MSSEPTHSDPAETSGSRRRIRRRKKHAIHFDLTETADAKFDRIIEAILIFTIAFAPIAIGAVQAWSEEVVILAAAAMSILLAIKLIIRRDAPFIWSWTYAPIAAFLLLVGLQLIPLPIGIVQLISPQTVELKRSLLAVVPDGARQLAHTTISFYREATLHDLRLLFAITAIFIVSINVIRQQRQVERMLLAMTIIGVGVAVICFGHLLVGAERIYGAYGRLPSAWPIAPFINRNHFGQFMNLSLGVAIAILLLRVERFIKEQRKTSNDEQEMILQIPPMLWALGAAAATIGVAVCLSLSRGAILSMIIASVVAILMSRQQGSKSRAWILAPVALAVLVVAVFFGFDLIADRFGVSDADSGGRWQIVKDTVAAWKRFPIIGTGMGTFQTFFPRVDTSNVANLATHAENEYVQMLLETGVIGVGMIIAFLGLMGSRMVRCLQSSPSSMASQIPGLAFALIAVVIQSASDFGQHLPANAAMCAVICAIISNLAEASERTAAVEFNVSSSSKLMRVGGLIAVACIAIGILYQADTRRAAERSWRQTRAIDARLEQHDWVGDNQDFALLLLGTADASQASPGNIQYRYWLNFYRWKSISQLRDAKTGQLKMSDQQIVWAQRIADDLTNAITLCPTFGPNYLLAGAIEKNILGKPEQGAAKIRVAYELSHTDPAANFEAATLDAEAGNWDAAITKLTHAASLSPEYLGEGIDLLIVNFHRPDLATTLAGQKVPAMRRVVDRLKQMDDTTSIEAAQARLEHLIDQQAADRNAPSTALIDAAELEFSRKHYDASARFYKRALQTNATRSDWRFGLAKSLAAAGQFDDALTEAQAADRLGANGAQSLIRELRLRPAATGQAP